MQQTTRPSTATGEMDTKRILIIDDNEVVRKTLMEFFDDLGHKVVTNIRQGVPYEEILKEAKEQGVDLIVTASLLLTMDRALYV